MGGVVAWGGEEGDEDVLEGADMEVEERLVEESEEDVASEDAGNGEFAPARGRFTMLR